HGRGPTCRSPRGPRRGAQFLRADYRRPALQPGVGTRLPAIFLGLRGLTISSGPGSKPPSPPLNVILFAPVARHLRQSFGAECKPRRLHSVAPKRVLEIPESTRAVECPRQLLANPLGPHRIREVPHDRPLVNFEVGGKLPEAIAEDNSLGDFPFFLLP